MNSAIITEKPPKFDSKLEARYHAYLTLRKQAGEIADFRWKGIALRLAPDVMYHPDAMVIALNGEIEVHETKGFWRDDAKVKFRVACGAFPFRFFVITEKAKRFVIEGPY